MADYPSQAYADKIARQQRAVWHLVNGGLESAVERVGGEVTNVNLKASGGGWLLVIKASFEGKAMVMFTSALGIGDALLVAEEAISANKAKWRDDRPYVPNVAQS